MTADEVESSPHPQGFYERVRERAGERERERESEGALSSSLCIHSHTYIHIYIQHTYLLACLCVSVCVCLCVVHMNTMVLSKNTQKKNTQIALYSSAVSPTLCLAIAS